MGKETPNTRQKSIYRTYWEPATAMPLFVRSCGHYRFNAPYMDRVKKKYFLELFWVINGICTFVYESKEWSIGPGWVFFYLPGDVHKVEIRTVRTEYAWVTISGPKLDNLISFFNIERGPRYAGICPVDIFTKLDAVMRDPSEKSEQEAGKTAFAILADAICGTLKGENIAESFKIMVRENLSDPSLCVAGIASALKVHRTTLHKAVRTDTGLSPRQYIVRCRVQEALSMILDTRQSFKELAAKCGFPDQNYFSKVIRTHLGHTPGELRKNRRF